MKKSFLPVILAAIFLIAAKGQSDDYWVYPELSEICSAGKCLCQNDDKEIAFAKGPGENDDDVWMTKVDSLGKIIFTKKIYDATSQSCANDILANGKNFIIAGIGTRDTSTTDYALLIKVDNSGNVIKDTTWIPSSYYTAGLTHVMESNGEYIAIGTVKRYRENYNLYIVKFNEDLEIQWEKFYREKIVTAVVKDGNSYVGMQQISEGKIFLIKFDENGDVVWEKEEDPGIGKYSFLVQNISVCNDGYIAIGLEQPSGNKSDKTLLIKFDKNGSFVWKKTYTELIGQHRGRNLWEINGEHILIVEYSKDFGSERYLIKTDNNHTILAMKKCGWYSSSASILTTDGKIIILGFDISGEKWFPSIYKTNYNFNSGIWHEENNQPQLRLLQNYPNPFNCFTCISYYLPEDGEINLAVYDLTGRRINTLFEGWQKSGQHSVYWQATDCPSGIYIYKISTADQTICKKMVLIK
jgi:hypothetical protein